MVLQTHIEKPNKMYEDILRRLGKSDFRSRFKLRAKERAYFEDKGSEIIRKHAEDFIRKRVAPAGLPNDGKQTPMKGHPVFIAQHATACCCRQCIKKWHGFSDAGCLSQEQQNYLVGLLMAWIEKQMESE